MLTNTSSLGLAVAASVALALSGCGGGASSGSGPMTDGGSMMPDPGSTTSHPPTATLNPTGEYRPVPIDGAEDHVFFKWGIWGGILRDDAATCTAIGCPPAGDAFFWAYLDREVDGAVIPTVAGVRSEISPTGGSAVWIGGVRAYETPVAHPPSTSATTYAPVEGKSRLEVDFAAGTVDVDFASFDNDRADMSWSGLALDNGEFGGGAAGIDGSFYGANHEGAAGTFDRDGLAGVFGAVRTSDQGMEAMQP